MADPPGWKEDPSPTTPPGWKEDPAPAAPAPTPWSISPLLARTGLGILGGVLGAPVFPPWGSVAGAGLGSAAGGAASRALGWEPIPKGLPAQLKQTGEEVLTGGASQAAGMIGGHLLARSPALTKGMSPLAISQLAKAEQIPLRAGDITGSRGLQKFENVPTYFPMGAGPTTRFAREQVEAAEKAAERFTTGLGPATSLRQGGLASKEELLAATAAWKQATDRSFRAVEAAIGPTSQVDTSRARAALKEILQRSGYAPMSAPTGAVKVASELEATLPPHMRVLMRGDKITYKQARDIMTEFAEMGGKGGPPVASIRQGKSKFIAQSMGRDIDAFMATQPQQVRDMARAARQQNDVGKEIFNKELFNAIAGKKGSVSPEDVVRNVFGDADTTAAFKHMASDTLWQRMQMAWMSDIMSKSMAPRLAGTSAGFSPGAFVKQMEPIIRDGRIDVILDPAAAQRVRGLVEVLGRLGRAEKLTGISSPEGFGGHMGFGQLRELLRFGPTLTGLAGGAVTGHPLTGAAFTLAGPYAIGKLTTNPRMIEAMSKGLSPTWSPTAVNLAAHLIGQGVEESTRGGSEPPAPAKTPAAERVSRQHPAVKAAREAGLSDAEIAKRYGLELTD